MVLKKSVLVTGASGFIGSFLCKRLLHEDLKVRGTLLPSEDPSVLVKGVEPITVESLGLNTDWNHALEGVDTVIHLAARVHIMDDKAAEPLTEYRRVNVEGTTQLARESVKAGVKRLVFISSIKVNGEEKSVPYTENSPPNPTDPYGISKWEAEQALRKIESETGLDIVILRPTLVYGPGVKANFYNMMKIIDLKIPLPLASIKNKRSFIYVGNLVDAIVVSTMHSAAAGQTYFVSDNNDVSTPDLICMMSTAFGVAVCLIPVPESLLRFVAILTGKSKPMNRLIGSLTVDTSKIRRELEWKPPYTMEMGLLDTVSWFKNASN